MLNANCFCQGESCTLILTEGDSAKACEKPAPWGTGAVERASEMRRPWQLLVSALLAAIVMVFSHCVANFGM